MYPNNEPSVEKLAKDIPARLYSQEKIPIKDQIVHAHFFVAGSDWWLTEYNPEEDLAFGFARLNGDDQSSEWGYVSVAELRQIKVGGMFHVEYDTYWSPKKASEVEAIKIY